MSVSPSALAARTRAIPPRALDAGLAALVLLVTLLEALTADGTTDAELQALGPAALLALGLVIRRREPIGAVVAGGLGLVLVNLLDDAVWEALNGVYFAFLFLVYSMAGRTDGRRLRVGLLVTAAAVLAISLSQSAEQRDGSALGAAALFVAFFVVAPVFAGRLLRSRERLNETLAARAELAAADREVAAQEAVDAERQRIASELHDLVAHALGAMTIQASAARRLATKDADRAAGAFEAVEQTGRSALAELRTLLAVLGDEEAGGPVPQPGLDDLPGLAARAQAAGLGVEVTVEGDRPGGLPAGVDLTGYRVVQDALRAARDQGGARSARVRLRYGGDRLDIEVADDGHRVAGRRLLGLRERVRLFGGEVIVDGQGTGGHRLRARLPTGAGS